MKTVSYVLFIVLFAGLSGYSQNTVDAQGKKQGYWKKTDEKTSKLQYEGLFKDDKPQGLFKYYYPNDSLRAKMFFVKDGKISYATLYHPSTAKKMAYGKYVGEVKDSVWTYYDESGTLISRDKYVMGKKDGTCYVYYPDGVVSEERNYKLDVQHGAFKQYYNNKALKGEGNYVNGQMEGKNAYYYPNGTAAASGYYKGGTKNGPWIYKDKDGKITKKELYKYGAEASAKETEEFFSKTKLEPDSKKPGTDTNNKPKTDGKKTVSPKK
ncbi:MAG: toxin-antitoxin system YwqK family antitoxin [Bacteroidetes bacterium]|nr:toxin-antitoxin system YwqK family antitoxin [Bacteroidota bacterium]